jgi:Flp pilus assembly secretin CpaC
MAPQLLVRSHMRRPLQIANGTDVSQLRAWLREALPQASRRQVVTDQAILHTTLARIVAPPTAAAGGGEGAALEAGRVLQAAVDKMTAELCGLRTTIDKLW